MKNIMNRVYSELLNGHSVSLAVLIEVVGSSPNKAGATIAIFESGETIGTIGGGAIEFFSIAEAFKNKNVQLLKDVSLTDSDERSVGMTCGGSAKILIRRFVSSDAELFHNLSDIERDKWLVFDLSSERAYIADSGAASPILLNETFILPVLKPEGAFVFGGGHIAIELVPILKQLNFFVSVFDDRTDFSTVDRFPSADSVAFVDFSDVKIDSITERDFVFVLTHGHIFDTAVLSQVLKSEARYIGCVGSTKKTAAMKTALSALGFSDANLNRIHSPIGLKIAAKSPAEIAISIAAEVILNRRTQNA
ncbi:MAG: XdhC family protein [Clostridia bacterium]